MLPATIRVTVRVGTDGHPRLVPLDARGRATLESLVALDGAELLLSLTLQNEISIQLAPRIAAGRGVR